jgi:hypothetical protein
MDLRIFRNTEDKYHDLRAAALSDGAALGVNMFTVREVAPEEIVVVVRHLEDYGEMIEDVFFRLRITNRGCRPRRTLKVLWWGL